MNEYLLRHAIKNVWCNPGQDRQFVYKLARLSPRHGVRGAFTLFYERVALPDPSARYHIYQIGQTIPKNIGVPQITRQWMSLRYLAEEHLLHTDLYVTNGIQFPRFETFVWITPGRNLVLAVRINPRIHDLEDSALYLRLYSNAYFTSARSEQRRSLITRGLRVTTDNGLVAFQRDIKDLVDAEGGFPVYYVNGRVMHNISLTTAGIGDVVEFILDGSIKRLVEFEVNDLRTFKSDLDDAWKYLLHYDDPSVTTIEYLDDVDIHLIQPGAQNRFTGVYYHHNEVTWLRMLTHKDYSLPTARLQQFVDTHTPDPRHQLDPVRWAEDAWSTTAGMRLRVYIRHAGYERPLVPNASRTQELYRLSSERIIAAMVGDDALVDLWHAKALEQSAYVRFMSAPHQVVYPIAFNRPNATSDGKVDAQEFVGDVYGYHAAATILAGTPSTVYLKDGFRYADLNYEHRHNATVFEYDNAGTLLEWHYHVKGTYYIPRNPDCVRIEALTGRGSYRGNTHFGTDPVDIPYGHNFRVYVKSMWRGEPSGEWLDITEAEDRADYGFWDYTVTPSRWVWTADPALWYGAVRVDDRFLCYDFKLTRQAGHLRFSITSLETHQLVEDERVMDLPPGQLDILLNGRGLIEGLDYTVQWPEVVISNLEYLTEEVQDITVRGYGFCRSDLSRLPIGEIGFVEYGVLSNNAVYDLHNPKVQRLVIDGHYHDPQDVVFDEQHNDLTIDTERNGAPYLIQTPPVVFRDVYPQDREARQADDARDQQISDYMTEYFPKRERETPNFIDTQYHVMSVFANKLLHDLREGHFYPDGIEDHYSDHDIREWCKAYEWLLPYDIANTDYDDIHIEVWPHWFGEPIDLTLYQYHFYVRALNVYLRHVPDLAPFIKVA